MNNPVPVVSVACISIVSIWTLYCAYRHYTALRHALFVFGAIVPMFALMYWIISLKG